MSPGKIVKIGTINDLFHLICEKKIIVVTGAYSGIRRATTILASQLGASIILMGRNKNKLNVIPSKMDANKSTHHILPFDLSRSEKLNELFENINSISNKIDDLFHYAGISIREPLRFINIEPVDQIIDIYPRNLKSVIHLISGFRKKCTFNSRASISAG